jgi:hypothetical protein
MERSIIVRLIALTVALLFVTSDAQESTNAQITAWLEAPRHNFKKYELFSVYLFVTNTGSETIRVPFASEYQRRALSLRMADAKGNQLHYSGVSSPVDRDSADLAPGDTVMFKVTPLQCFSSGGWQEDTPLYIPPGTYELSGTYWSTCELKPLELSVEDLNEDETGIVKEYDKTICRFTHGEDRVSDFAGLLAKYRHTFLGTRLAYDLLCEAAGAKSPRGQLVGYASSIIEDFPGSGVLSSAFGYLCAVMDDSTLASTLQDRREIDTNTYSRFMLKEACRESGKMNVYREVMGQ